MTKPKTNYTKVSPVSSPRVGPCYSIKKTTHSPYSILRKNTGKPFVYNNITGKKNTVYELKKLFMTVKLNKIEEYIDEHNNNCLFSFNMYRYKRVYQYNIIKEKVRNYNSSILALRRHRDDLIVTNFTSLKNDIHDKLTDLMNCARLMKGEIMSQYSIGNSKFVDVILEPLIENLMVAEKLFKDRTEINKPKKTDNTRKANNAKTVKRVSFSL